MESGREQILTGPEQFVELTPAPGETLDAICRGEVYLLQRRSGYRFSVDALLVAAFGGRPRGKVVDLGTGCGVVALLLAKRGATSVIGVELQPPLFALAWRNVQLNRCEDRVQIVNADLREIRGVLPGGAFDAVVSNPPYIAARAGRANPETEKAVARHELCCSVADVSRAARWLLREGGSFRVIFPAPRLGELLISLSAERLEPKRLRIVHTLANRPAKLVLVEAIKGAKVDLEVLPPLVLHEESGEYTAEARQLLSDVGATFGPDSARS
jgi:tRNA1(Val) A37 N6-methylase TrmN6